jgi:hypothetical protein
MGCMFKHYSLVRSSYVTTFCSSLIVLTALFVFARVTAGQTIQGPAAKQKLEQIGVGNTATVRRKDGLIFSGVISKLSEGSAVIADRSLNVNIEIAYDEMLDVIPGAASGKTWNGKAKVSHTRRNVAIILLAAGILIPVIISASRSRSSGPVFSPAP